MKLSSGPTLEESVKRSTVRTTRTRPKKNWPTLIRFYTLTCPLKKSKVLSVITRSAGSAIGEDFALDFIPEFVFIEDLESENSVVVLERKSIVWQPSSLPPQLQELILADLFGMS